MSKEFRVGLMFLVALGLVALTVYYIGNFQERLSYKIRFEKVSGLEVDSPVHFNGVPVGRVRKIVLAEDTLPASRTDVVVSIDVHRSMKNHIRKSTRADIRSIGILGDKFVLLVTKDYNQELLEEGQNIPPVENKFNVDQLLEQGTDLVADVSIMTEDLKTLFDQLANGKGTFQTLISDKTLADRISRTVGNSLNNVESGESALGLLMNNEEFAGELKSVVSQLENTLHEVEDLFKDSNGLVPTMFEDEAYKQQVLQRIDNLLNEANTLIHNYSEARGLLYKLTQDEAYGERVASNIDKASYHLASILEKIDTGNGSASLLINDPSLYEGLYEVVYGVQHSGITKWFIRKKRKQGEKLLEKENASEKDGSPQ